MLMKEPAIFNVVYPRGITTTSNQKTLTLTTEEPQYLWEADYEIFSILQAHLGNSHPWIEQMAPRFQHFTTEGLPLE